MWAKVFNNNINKIYFLLNNYCIDVFGVYYGDSNIRLYIKPQPV